MNRKALGASLRRGILTGTVAGFVAGWTAFAGHSKQLDQMQVDAWQDVEQKKADLLLPPVPQLPLLGDLPRAAGYGVRYGPSGPVPRVVPGAGAPTVTSAPAVVPPAGAGSGGAPVAPPPPAPTFAPLPPLPPAPATPAPVTQPTPTKP